MDWEIEVTKIQATLSSLYDKTLTKEQVRAHRTVLKSLGLSIDEVARAAEIWWSDEKNTKFPLPAQLKALVRHQPDTEGEAGLISDRIWAALSFGTDRLGEERARKLIDSDAGWAVVQNHGGWHSFNTSVTDVEQAPVLKSQWRKAILEMIQKKKRGEPLVPRLPNSDFRLKELGVEMKNLE